MLVEKVILGLSYCIYILTAQITHVSSSYVDGSLSFGPWTAWSGCSTSCNSFLASRTRQCLYSDKSEQISKCSGVRKQYKTCDILTCIEKRKNYRTSECDRQLHIPFRGRRYHWQPHINEAKPCEVTCRAVRFGFYTGFGKLVKDGVPCSDTNDDTVCLHGRCQRYPTHTDVCFKQVLRLHYQDQCRQSYTV